MSTEVKRKKIVYWPIIVVVAVGLAVRFLPSGHPDSGATELDVPLFRSSGEAHENLNEAEKLTAGPFQKVMNDDELTQQDRDQLMRAGVIFEGAVAFEPQNALGPMIGAGMTYRALGADDKAAKYLNEAIALGEGSDKPSARTSVAEAHYNLSLIAFGKHDYTGARDEADKAIAIVNMNPNYFASRAAASIELKQKDEALTDIAKALDLDPKNKRALGLKKLLTAALFR